MIYEIYPATQITLSHVFALVKQSLQRKEDEKEMDRS